MGQQIWRRCQKVVGADASEDACSLALSARGKRAARGETAPLPCSDLGTSTYLLTIFIADGFVPEMRMSTQYRAHMQKFTPSRADRAREGSKAPVANEGRHSVGHKNDRYEQPFRRVELRKQRHDEYAICSLKKTGTSQATNEPSCSSGVARSCTHLTTTACCDAQQRLRSLTYNGG